MSTLGVFTGGGGVGLCAHIGALRACSALGLEFDVVSGASPGGIAALAYALGVPMAALEEYFSSLPSDAIERSRPWWKIRVRGPRGYRVRSIHDPANARHHIGEALKLAQYVEPMLPCHVWAVDLRTAAKVDVVELRKLGMAYEDMALATMAAPPLLPPLDFKAARLIDGGVRFNFPLPEDWRKYDKVVVFNTSGPYKYRDQDDIITLTLNTMKIMLADQTLDPLEELELASRTAFNGKPKVTIVDLVFPSKGLLQLDKSVIRKAFARTSEVLCRMK